MHHSLTFNMNTFILYISMNNFKKKDRPKYRKDITLIYSSIILALLSLVILTLILLQYQQQINSITLSENHFLNIEWNLLQVMKAHTESRLREKDQEIAELRRKYQALSKIDGDSLTLQNLAVKIQLARKERDIILQEQLTISLENPDIMADLELPNPEMGNFTDHSDITRLLQEDILNLQTRLQDFEDIQLEQQQSLLELDDKNPTSLETLQTQAVLRAILSSPEIRSQYPNFLSSLDLYLEEYGNRKYIEGKIEAYREMQQEDRNPNP